MEKVLAMLAEGGGGGQQVLGYLLHSSLKF